MCTCANRRAVGAVMGQNYLLAIAYHTSSDWFTTFVGNCDKDRATRRAKCVAQVARRLHSLVSHTAVAVVGVISEASLWELVAARKSVFMNPLYRQEYDGRHNCLPLDRTCLKRVHLWPALHLRVRVWLRVCNSRDLAVLHVHNTIVGALACAGVAHCVSRPRVSNRRHPS